MHLPRPALAALLVLSLLAGCLEKPATPAPVTPPAIIASGATLTREGDTATVVWTGHLDRAASALPVAPPAIPDPTRPADHHIDDHKATLPADVTLMQGRLEWKGDSTLSLSVLNETGRRVCGELAVSPGPGACFFTRYVRPTDAKEWTFRASLDAPDGGSVDYTMTFNFTNRPLPLLGAPAPYGPSAPLRFDPPVIVDPSVHSAEPSIAVTPGGTVYISAPAGPQKALWRSTDGRSFTPVSVHGTTTDPGSAWPVGGGDSDVAVFGDGTLYFADQQGGSAETVSSSHDGGQTWFTQPLATGTPSGSGINGLAPASPTPLPAPVPGVPSALSADRQWLVTDGTQTVWLAFNGGVPTVPARTPLDGATVVKSLDGGRTWPIRTVIPEDGCFRGNLARAPDGTLYLAGCDGNGPGVAVSKDGGLSFTWHPVARRDGKTDTSFCFPCHIFSVVTTDAAGNAYTVWSDEAQTPEAHGAPPAGAKGLTIWLSSSTDQGSTWSTPKRVNQQPGDYVLPWATGGSPGHVAVAYYGTRFSGNPERALGEWYPIVAQSAEATSADPAWSEAAATPFPVQYGPICMRGSACGGARNLLDFFQIQADQAGRLHIATVDGRPGVSARLSTILYVHQTDGANLGGPSVDKSGGVAGPLPGPLNPPGP
jgi:hypothetical protein